MANKVVQYRYYGEGNENNYPKDASATSFVNGSAFLHMPILQLGIQTLPGVKIHINSQTSTPVIIGATGIYELDLSNNVEINSLYIDAFSMENIQSNPNSYLIIDTVYESEGE